MHPILPLLSCTLLATLPTLALAQVTHHYLDPVATTQGCQNPVTAYHLNGDVVKVDYHGQWQNVGVHKIQNAGYQGAACSIERISRISPEGGVVWEVLPDEQGETGVRRRDQVSSLVALPSGDTMISYRGAASEHGYEQTVTVARLDRSGRERWRFRNTKHVQASNSEVRVGNAGEVFVNYSITNYGKAGGEFQLPGGRLWRPRKNSLISLLVRLEPVTGRLLWERQGVSLVSAQNGELLALRAQTRRRPVRSMRLKILRMDYQARLKSRAWTPWFKREILVNAMRFDGKLALVTNLEVVNEALQQVQHRYNYFRIFDLRGKKLLAQDVSDGSVLASASPGAPLRLLSPTDCDKRVYSCLTSKVEILTMRDSRSKPQYSSMTFADSKVDSRTLMGHSESRGLWMSGVSFVGPQMAPGTMTRFSPDAERSNAQHLPKYVWRPSSKSIGTANAKEVHSF